MYPPSDADYAYVMNCQSILYNVDKVIFKLKGQYIPSPCLSVYLPLSLSVSPMKKILLIGPKLAPAITINKESLELLKLGESGPQAGNLSLVAHHKVKKKIIKI